MLAVSGHERRGGVSYLPDRSGHDVARGGPSVEHQDCPRRSAEYGSGDLAAAMPIGQKNGVGRIAE